MNLTAILTDVISLLFGGGLGAFIARLYTARAEKKRIEAESKKIETETKRKQIDNKQDIFDAIYQQLNKCISDYTLIADEYRAYREKVRKHEETIQKQIDDKCIELAAMKSKIQYLKGIRCYNFTCENRIKINPDKKLE